MGELIMKKHVTAVGAIHTGLGLIGIVAAVIAFFAINFAKGFVEGDEIPYMVLKFLSLSIPIFIGFLSTFALVGGIGLLMLYSWARYLGIVVAALECFIIPVGTFIGVYSLWVLFQNDTINLFENKTPSKSDL